MVTTDQSKLEWLQSITIFIMIIVYCRSWDSDFIPDRSCIVCFHCTGLLWVCLQSTCCWVSLHLCICIIRRTAGMDV